MHEIRAENFLEHNLYDLVKLKMLGVYNVG